MYKINYKWKFDSAFTDYLHNPWETMTFKETVPNNRLDLSDVFLPENITYVAGVFCIQFLCSNNSKKVIS